MIRLGGRKQQPQKLLSAVKGCAFSGRTTPSHETRKHACRADSVLRRMLSFRQSLSLDTFRQPRAPVSHEASRPRSKAGLVTLVPRSRALDDVTHPQHRPVGHADFRL